MGMGYVHTSNVAQCLPITVLLRWYQIFKGLDALFLAAERKKNKVLDQYLSTRAAMPQNKDQLLQGSARAGRSRLLFSKPGAHGLAADLATGGPTGPLGI